MKKLLALLTLALGLSYGYQNSPVQLHNLGAAQAVIEAPGQGFGTVVFQITGTWSGTITFEGTVTGTWVAIPGTDLSATTSSTTTTANGMYAVACVGLNKVRARMSAYTSGTASVSGMAVDGIPSATLSSSGSGGAVTQSGIWNVRIQDSAGVAIGSTGKALDVNIKSGASSGTVAQGSTTSGQTGGLNQAAVTTAAPTYTTGQTNPLSLNTSGGLRVDPSGVTSPVSLASVPSHPVTNAGTFPTQVTSVPADPFGANADAASATGSLSAKLRFIAGTGIPVTSVPADPFGANADAASATGSMSAKLRFIAGTGIPVTSVPTDPFGANADAASASGSISAKLRQIATNGITVQPGNTANTTPWLFTDVPATSGGWTMTKLISAATTNATSVKASAGQVGAWFLYNSNASVRYLKLYNKASAPTVGTDTPVWTIPIPSGAAGNVEFGKGLAFSTGIAFAITAGIADNDNTAVAANEVVVNLGYK